MPQEFFSDAELDTVRKAVTLISNDLERLSTRIHDFSKQRLHSRLEMICGDLATVMKTLPKD